MLPLSSPLGPTLETQRLWLRPPVAEDFDGFCEMHSDEEAMRFVGGTSSPALTWRLMRQIAGAWALDGFFMFSVIEKASGQWIGRIGPIYPHGWPGREVGWGLKRSAQGKGYAVEAAAATVDYVFDVLGWDEVIHVIDPENIPSQRVAQKLGSVNRGPGKLPDPYASAQVDVWGQGRDDWTRNRQNL